MDSDRADDIGVGVLRYLGRLWVRAPVRKAHTCAACVPTRAEFDALPEGDPFPVHMIGRGVLAWRILAEIDLGRYGRSSRIEDRCFRTLARRSVSAGQPCPGSGSSSQSSSSQVGRFVFRRTSLRLANRSSPRTRLSI